MWGILLTLLGTFSDEVVDSLGKRQVARKIQNIYTMGFLQFFAGLIFFIAIALIHRQAFIFSWNSLPSLTIRIILEIVQAHVALLAVVHAERSTFSFIRTGTIPLLLLVDVLLGYTLSPPQIVGIALIAITLLFIFSNHQFNKVGLGYVVFSTVNAVITISLYKYNITHFNSVVAEQIIMLTILLFYFFILGWHKFKTNPLREMRRPLFAAQSLCAGISDVLQSFAYHFAPASVIIAAMRSSAVLWSALSGKVYFKETNLPLKLFFFFLLTVGVMLLTR